MNTKRKIYINNDLDIVMVRLQVREMAKEMGFKTSDQARISLAASELARAVFFWRATEPGEIVMSDVKRNGCYGLQVVCLIRLEYIPMGDVSNGEKRTSVPGRSLAGACRLVDESSFEAQDGEQARVTLVKWLESSSVV